MSMDTIPSKDTIGGIIRPEQNSGSLGRMCQTQKEPAWTSEILQSKLLIGLTSTIAASHLADLQENSHQQNCRLAEVH